MNIRNILLEMDKLFADCMSFDNFMESVPNSVLIAFDNRVLSSASFTELELDSISLQSLGYECSPNLMASHWVYYFLALDTPKLASELARSGSLAHYLPYYARLLQYFFLEGEARSLKQLIPVGVCQLHVDAGLVYALKSPESLQHQRQRLVADLIQQEKANVLTQLWLDKVKEPKV